MTMDRELITQKKETLHKIHYMYKTIIANLLYSRYKKEFKTTKTKVGNQIISVDLMSADKTIIVKIINSKLRTHDQINSRIFKHIMSGILNLCLVDSKIKLLIFTNKITYEKFYTSLAVMPYPISHMRELIMIACIPLSDGFTDDEFCDHSNKYEMLLNSLDYAWGEMNDKNHS